MRQPITGEHFLPRLQERAVHDGRSFFREQALRRLFRVENVAFVLVLLALFAAGVKQAHDARAARGNHTCEPRR